MVTPETPSGCLLFKSLSREIDFSFMIKLMIDSGVEINELTERDWGRIENDNVNLQAENQCQSVRNDESTGDSLSKG